MPYLTRATNSHVFILLFLVSTPFFHFSMAQVLNFIFCFLQNMFFTLFPSAGSSLDPWQKVELKVLTMIDEKTKKKAIEAAADIYGGCSLY